jgi:phage anti-repressor protein/phage antirepressor YoqD-like protein
MNEIIKIESTEGRRTVNARELHAFLEVKSEFRNWIKNRVEDFGFVENQDFVTVGKNLPGGGKQNDYHLTIEMAKELSMVERNDKGKQARQYFIECERVALTPALQLPQTFAESLRMLADEVEQKQAALLQIEADRPKVELATAIEASTKAVKIEEFAKAISKPPRQIIGRNTMYQILRNLGMIGSFNNLPLQHYIDCGWFEVKQGTYENKGTNGPRSCFTTLLTGKGQVAVYKKVMDYLGRKEVAHV